MGGPRGQGPPSVSTCEISSVSSTDEYLFSPMIRNHARDPKVMFRTGVQGGTAPPPVFSSVRRLPSAAEPLGGSRTIQASGDGRSHGGIRAREQEGNEEPHTERGPVPLTPPCET
eukprot:10195044-Lingulodinium_polyedra.AAC.3